MLKTISSTRPGQAVPSGDETRGRIGRTGSCIFPLYTGAPPKGGTVLAVRPMRAGFDVGARPEAGHPIDTVAEASIRCKAENGREAERNCVELGTTSPAMRGAEAHAHRNMPGRVSKCVENT